MLNNLEQIKPRLKQVFDLGNKDLFFHLEIMQSYKSLNFFPDKLTHTTTFGTVFAISILYKII